MWRTRIGCKCMLVVLKSSEFECMRILSSRSDLGQGQTVCLTLGTPQSNYSSMSPVSHQGRKEKLRSAPRRDPFHQQIRRDIRSAGSRNRKE